MSINYRRSPEADTARGMLMGRIKNLCEGLKSAWPVSFLVREVLDRCETYDAAVATLRGSDLMAPTFITIAGMAAGEGIVLTRNRSGREASPVRDWVLGIDGAVVQANMDHILHDVSSSSSADGDDREGFEGGRRVIVDICNSRRRRDVARAAIASKPEGEITSGDLWALLSCPPCLARDTVYTVAMQPSTGLYITRVSASNWARAHGREVWGAFIAALPTEHEEEDRGSSRAGSRLEL